LTSKLIALLIGMVGAIVILDHFGINIGSLLVSLGVGSLAVALAAQDTLANMIAGFVIMVDRPFRVGDRIELPTGQVGDVHRIGLRSTQILNFDNNLIIVPNAELIKSRIVNFAFPFNQMRVLVKFGVAYGASPEQVRTILLDIVRAHPEVVSDPQPEVFFTAMNDSSLEFTLIARAAEYQKRFDIECTLREQAYLAFQKAGIEIPFPQRVVHMKSSS
jgi:small-conductance mechanosensitive channel